MTVTEQEIANYVGRVRAALADLPAEVRDELTEDLPEHLAEVAAEADGSLVERLGEPEAYAAELRAAAGAPATAAGRNLDQRVAAVVGRTRRQARQLDTQLGPLLGYARASEFLRLLRPAWWVVRGYLAAMLVTVITTGGSFGLLPRFGGELVGGLVMLVGFLLASIWLGHRSARLRRWPRWAMHAASLVLVVFALAGLANAEDRAGYQDYGYDAISVDNPYERVRDVFVYDSEGRLVEDARLFDQNGAPIRLGYPDCPDPRDPSGTGNPLLRTYPYCPDQAPFAPRAPAAPAPTVPPLGTPTPAATGAPEPTGGPAATGTPTPGATASPSGTPTPTATP
ncbi:hypothetical protein DLJ47_12800 [Micromonospora sp. S4605]|uniref:HAAS signaling domain-containing protein n=1 Tax=Micromonospora sp. S4605 TaxID=1420897 RepID=UPI000D6ECC75|nr:hypothetical protein [Micromonospora sp. S4605]PWU54526.1 hypothetical protein DLJ47_12800 [Micromonospora sp. S4605]